jgi:hypothetical protein
VYQSITINEFLMFSRQMTAENLKNSEKVNDKLPLPSHTAITGTCKTHNNILVF